MSDRLPDQWDPRDYRLLLAVAARVDAAPGVELWVSNVAEEAGLDRDDSVRAGVALLEAHLDGSRLELAETGTHDVSVTGLTERGRRAVGLWPPEDPLAVLVEVLRRAEAEAANAEDKSRFRRALEALGGASKEAGIQVAAALAVALAGLS